MQAEVIQGTLEVPLTALDRCDRCGGQAYVRAELASGGELLFCSHHWTEHGPFHDWSNVHNEIQKLIDQESPQVYTE